MATISHEIKISAAPADVYKSLTTVADLRNWCAGTVTHPAGAAAASQGEAIDMHFGDRKDFRWEFVRLEPGQRVAWKCVAGPDDAAGKEVVFDLAETGDGRTCVSLSHGGWPDTHPEFVRCNTRWGALLGQLKNYIEHGATQKAVT